jgi:Zn-dependent protease/CBS domain-containing protein
MFARRIHLFKLFGFNVNLDVSWFFLLILVTWSLASGFFPRSYQGLSTLSYWIMGIAAAMGLFFSIVLHETLHSIVARRFGLPMTGITLFLFGGVAEMSDEPPSPKAEFSMAIAGPILSIVLAGFFYGTSVLVKESGLSPSLWGVLRYLGFINGLLAAFNMVPAFPLDGGRVLRSAIWKVRDDLRAATRITSMIGRVFGFVLIAFGMYSFIMGSLMSGLWWFVIGLFLNTAARTSYQQLKVRTALEGQKVSRFMKTDPVTVPDDVTVNELVEEYMYRYHYKLFPVVRDGQLIGCVTTKQTKELPREEWGSRRVGEIAEECTDENSVSPERDAVKVLGTMRRNGISRLMVVKDKKLVGVITLKDLLEFIAMKLELEQEK